MDYKEQIMSLPTLKTIDDANQNGGVAYFRNYDDMGNAITIRGYEPRRTLACLEYPWLAEKCVEEDVE